METTCGRRDSVKAALQEAGYLQKAVSKQQIAEFVSSLGMSARDCETLLCALPQKDTFDLGSLIDWIFSDAAGTSVMSTGPFAIFVSFEVKPDHMDEFYKVMEMDAECTRAESGCLRFDFLKDKDNPHKFYLYEVYVDKASARKHGQTEHYKMWNSFKTEKGGLVEGSLQKVLSSAINFQQ
eukprot:TRINITY_DN66997_c0_g1_i1.p1 TRINITY_DN66997_c0_g1~~TRINITY_DN66997_c0_g1_i1.p1  ORF type:complete len:181 (-),score=52.43 TRINITY_DN66997_c0_g1_i1:109-651(-)